MRSRTMFTLLIAFAAALLGSATAAAATEPFIPGYTDVPNALRVADQLHPPIIAGYTDVPNALRMQGNAPLTALELRQMDRAARAAGVPVATATASQRGFAWGDAGIGGAVVAAAMLAAASILTLRRRLGAASTA